MCLIVSQDPEDERSAEHRDEREKAYISYNSKNLLALIAAIILQLNPFYSIFAIASIGFFYYSEICG